MANTERVKFSELHYKTLLRNLLVAFALAVGFLFYQLVRDKGGPFMVKGFTRNLLAFFWFTYGGHFVDLFIVNWLRYKLPASRIVEVGCTFLVWYIGGCIIFLVASLTNRFFFGHFYSLNWYYAGFILIGVELVARISMRITRGEGAWNKKE